MKKQVLYIHGGDAFSNHDDFLNYLRTVPLRNLPGNESKGFWSATLAEDLGPEYEVFAPSMPNKLNASYEEWSIWLERHFPYLRDGVVLVGWSLGGMFLAKYLAENDLPFTPGKVFLLAAPCGHCDDGQGNDCGSFQFGSGVLEKLAKKELDIEIWHSEDDFVVPFSSALEFEKALPLAKTRLFVDKNHFLLEKLPELLEKIKTL